MKSVQRFEEYTFLGKLCVACKVRDAALESGSLATILQCTRCSLSCNFGTIFFARYVAQSMHRLVRPIV